MTNQISKKTTPRFDRTVEMHRGIFLFLVISLVKTGLIVVARLSLNQIDTPLLCGMQWLQQNDCCMICFHW